MRSGREYPSRGLPRRGRPGEELAPATSRSPKCNPRRAGGSRSQEGLGLFLNRIGAGVEQVGVAAADGAVTEHDDAAAAAEAAVDQVDMNGIKPVTHGPEARPRRRCRRPVAFVNRKRRHEAGAIFLCELSALKPGT